MKKTLKKLLICILIFVIVNNFLVGNISFADDGSPDIDGWITNMLGTVVGIFSWIPRVFAIAIGFAAQSLTSIIAYSEGSVTDEGEYNKSGFAIITPFDILFNKVALLDINFFNINWSNDGDAIHTIRTSIASWYYVMRNLAAAILLCIFIYVGIRMAISTVASEKANYKKMLVDWVCSLAIIFVLQYIMIFTLNVNSVIVNSLYEIGKGMGTGEALSDSIGKIAGMSFGVTATAIGATIVYCMIIGQTLGLFFTYFNRMLKLAFLVIISPLITLTYSIDKMGDGKAQALQTWLKEFVYTVLIQPFHCIIFLVFINMALDILKGESESQLAGMVIAMLCINFTKNGEKILGKIFKFGESTSDTSLAFGLAASTVALNKAKNIGSGARKGLNALKKGKRSC